MAIEASRSDTGRSPGRRSPCHLRRLYHDPDSVASISEKALTIQGNLAMIAFLEPHIEVVLADTALLTTTISSDGPEVVLWHQTCVRNQVNPGGRGAKCDWSEEHKCRQRRRWMLPGHLLNRVSQVRILPGAPSGTGGISFEPTDTPSSRQPARLAAYLAGGVGDPAGDSGLKGAAQRTGTRPSQAHSQ